MKHRRTWIMMGRIKNKNVLLDSILLLLALSSMFYLGIGFLKNRQDRQKDRELRAEAIIWPPGLLDRRESIPPQTYRSPVNFERLREINPDIVAWLTIPGTEIDYPVVQADNNDKYLTIDFYGNASKGGAIFLDCDSNRDFERRHTIVYGHHMRNKRMFAPLEQFKEEEFFNNHREIFLYTPQKEWKLHTIAAVYGNSDGEKRRTSFQSEEEFSAYIDKVTNGSQLNAQVKKPVKQLFSFVTCSYEFQNARTILYALEAHN